MHFVRIDKKGWDQFSGLLGAVPFKDGVSERPLTKEEIARLGSVIQIALVDTGEQAGAGVDVLAGRKVSAEVKTPLPTATEEKPASTDVKYNREYLEEVAEKGGIKAIRTIAKEFGVKGVQISEIIDEILEAQSKEAE